MRLQGEALDVTLSVPDSQKMDAYLMTRGHNHKVLDGYEVLEVRQGGMSTVYICDSKLFGEKVAVKEPRGELLSDRRARTLFVRECHAWSLLGTHPNIVSVRLLHLVSGVRPQLVLEYVPTNLRERMRESHLTLATALRIAIQVCDGMRYCNQVLPGVVHRDLKPENIMIASDGTAKVTDFGLVRTLRALERPDVADRRGTMRVAFPDADRRPGPDRFPAAGTWGYMSPEQLRGAADLDPRSDIYSLGCILFEMLAGRLPFRSAARREDDTLYLEEPVRDLPSFDGSLRLAEVVGRCLENDPSRRYSGFEPLRQDLAKIGREYCDIEIAPATGTPLGLEINILMALLKLGDLDTVERICESAQVDSDQEREWVESLLGRVASGKQQWSSAIAHLEKAIELAEERDPKHATVHLHALGMAYEGSGDLRRAIEVQERVVALQPGMAVGWHNLGLRQRRAGRLDAAIRCFRKARTLAGDPGHFVVLANTLAVGKGDLDEALAELDTALRVDPNSPDVHAERARILTLKFSKRVEEERAVSDGALRLLSEANTHCNRARELGFSPSDIQPIQEGIAKITSLLNKLPSPTSSVECDIALARGRRFEEKGDCESALSEYESALNVDPDPSIALLQAGIAHFNLGEPQRAIECWDRLLEIDPEHAQAWANRSGALLEMGEVELALESCDRALVIDPGSVVALSNRASCLQRLGRFEEAVTLYDAAIASDPGRAALWYGKGTSLAWIGKTDRAIACFDRTLALDSRHLAALCDKGLALMSAGRHNKSVDCFNQAIEIDPGFARAWFGKGAVLANGFHLYREALDHFKRARELGDREAERAISQIEGLLRSSGEE